MTTIPARDFSLAVSMSDFVVWLGDGDNDFSENEALRAVLKGLGITVDLRVLHATYFHSTLVGSGNVYVYRSDKNSKNVFAIDLYRDLTDQMDIVSFAVGCDEHCLSVVRSNLRKFFDEASCQVHYEEASYSSRLRHMIDPTSYPVIIEESGYVQQMHDLHV